MIPRIDVIIVKNGQMHRECFKLPNVTVQEFDTDAHWNVKFNWEGSEDFSTDGIRIWTTVELTEEEMAYLAEEGKMGAYKPN